MGRRPCCSKVGLNKGQWTAVEDKILTSYIKVHGHGQWRNLPKRAGLKICGKSCRLRWLNYLKPGVKRGNITPDEKDLILRLHRLLGNRWTLIAGRLSGRTCNEIKNYWNTKIAKKANPPSRKSNRNGPSTVTDVLKPLLTKATRPQAMRPQAVRLSTKLFPLINSNSPQPLSKSFDNFLSIENFLMEDCTIGDGRSGGEYEINKNHKDMESLEMFLNAEKWL